MSSEEEHENESIDNKIAKCPVNFLNIVKRLHLKNKSLCFWNVSKEFKILLRSVSDDPMSLISLELIIVHEDEDSDSDSEEDNTLAEILDLDYDGYYDEDSNDEYYIVDTLSIPCGATPSYPAVTCAMDAVNELYATRFCDCQKYFLKPGNSICNFCEMTANSADMEPVLCPICHVEAPKLHMTYQKCCNQPVHTKCIDEWKKHKKRAREDPGCPMCRAAIV